MANEDTIKAFYTAFQHKDWKTMQSCYHEAASFSDPVFPNLNSKQAKAMWHMLVAASTDLEITFTNINVSGQTGSCHWEAFYTFSKTGRKVHNKIDAKFEFKEGLIVKHTDYFDLWKWTGMALGLKGSLLGWTPFVQKKVRVMAGRNLEKFQAENPQYL